MNIRHAVGCSECDVERFIVRLIIWAGESEIGEQLRKWMSWTQRCQIPAFQQRREKNGRHFSAIIASAKYKLFNARMEAINTKIKRVIRKAYGFRNPGNLMVMLTCSNINICLPNRVANPLN